MSEREKESLRRGAGAVALALSFTAGVSCASRENNEGGGGKALDDLLDAQQDAIELQCECYVQSDYGMDYYDSVEECIDERGGEEIPIDDCVEMVLTGSKAGREWLQCNADVIEQFNMCVKERGCTSEYEGVPYECYEIYEEGYYGCELDVDLYVRIAEDCYGYTPEEPFSCANGEQIPGDWVCDDDNDCGDNSDEVDCEDFICDGGEYEIPEAWVCDGYADCADETDEANCVTTPLIPDGVTGLARAPRADWAPPMSIPEAFNLGVGKPPKSRRQSR